MFFMAFRACLHLPKAQVQAPAQTYSDSIARIVPQLQAKAIAVRLQPFYDHLRQPPCPTSSAPTPVNAHTASNRWRERRSTMRVAEPVSMG